MILAALLFLASAQPADDVFDGRALDWSPLTRLTADDKIERVRALFPTTKYFRRDEPDCELSLEAPGKVGCDELDLSHYRLTDGVYYSVRFLFDWKGRLSTVFLSGADLDEAAFQGSAEDLQLLLTHHYGHEVCRLGGECYYGSSLVGRATLRPFVYQETDGTWHHSTSIEIAPPLPTSLRAAQLHVRR